MEAEIHARMAPAHARWEGDMLKAYICPAGFLSVGRGHNCVASPVPGVTKVGDRIDAATLERLYAEDVKKVFVQLDLYFPWWRKLDAPRAAVLFDMCFNMGPGYPPKYNAKGQKVDGGKGLRSFVNTLKHIENGNYAAAAAGMRQSKWAGQVKGRAVTLCKQMETGVWQV